MTIKEEIIVVSNNNAAELRNCIDAFIMVCGYTGHQETPAYIPKKTLIRDKEGRADFDIFLSIKACTMEANSTIHVKVANAEVQKEDSLYSIVVAEYSIPQLYEYANDGLVDENRLAYDPYDLKVLLSIGMKDIKFIREGKYVVVIDTQTNTGENVLLDAYYFEVI